jgi:hypothetical protein
MHFTEKKENVTSFSLVIRSLDSLKSPFTPLLEQKKNTLFIRRKIEKKRWLDLIDYSAKIKEVMFFFALDSTDSMVNFPKNCLSV